MFNPAKHQYYICSGQYFDVNKMPTSLPENVPSSKACKAKLKKIIKQVDDLQQILYAQDKYALLLIFQAMDAAGKDSTIRAVTRGLNPAGFQVHSFKQPSKRELEHDFLWRSVKALPERGRIGVFNRSYYEEVLVVKVHPEYIHNQRLPVISDQIWQQRYESIIDHERHLSRNGTIIIKFWLNVSAQEQKNRFISRIDEPKKNWKFSSSDIKERQYWCDYMHAYENLINATTKPWAPWYAIPADNKPYMRLQVGKIILDTLAGLDLKYPLLSNQENDKLAKMREQLNNE